MMCIGFLLNGRPVTVHTDPADNLLHVLRDELGLTGTKQGCDHEGECGACTVLLDGLPVRSCLTPVGKVQGRQVQTIEGLGTPDHLHPLQTAFIEVGAVQCGYCTPGILLAAKALVDRHPAPTQEQIIEAIAGNLCRCTGYGAIVRAIQVAAARIRGGPPPVPDSGYVDDRAPVGGSSLRTDSIAKVTGQARYVEDISKPGLLHAKVLRSPYAHAQLRGLSTDEALRQPGVVAILTAADIPGQNGLFDYSRNEPVLTPLGETVKMLGAPVALVAAETSEQAEAALAAMTVDYEPLPHTYDVEEALREGALALYPGGNVLTCETVAHGDLEAAFARSDLVLATTYHTAYQEHAALEREALLGYLDEAGRVTVVGGTHQPHWQQQYLAGLLDVPVDAVRVIMPPTGGSFGGRQDPWPFLATGLVTFHTRQPVRLAYSRHESFVASPKRHPYDVRYRVGARQDGRLTGIHVRIKANTGGYDAHGQYLSNYAVMASGGAYRWQAVDALAQTVYTNGPKSGQFRGFGTPQPTFALECTLDEVCARLDLDPLELRLQNAIDQHTVSFLGYPVAESMGYAEVLKTLRPHYRRAQADAARFNAAANSADSPALLRKGVGLAGMWYRFGKSGSLRVDVHAELAQDGHFVVYCSAPDYGQGTNTVMSQLAAEGLGVPRERIRLVNADTAHTPDSGIQGASRATYWVGNAVQDAVHNLRTEILAVASELMDCHPAHLRLDDTDVVSGGQPPQRLDLAEIAREFDRIGQPRRVVGRFDPSPLFPADTRPEYTPHFVTGAHLVELMVDLRTGLVQVTRVVAAHDIGRAINPLDARGQIEGAVVMGLGTALMEEFIPGKTQGFGDYYLPTARSMPEMEVLLVEVPSFHGPLGAKGLGEAAILPTAPAVVNAISRAIGIRIRSLPATPERIRHAITKGTP
jgi:CO/xanthine dehydrogenase Mo-binding subunit/aerobic-type carbon monoxide dehydrogenase small subunit (CoxS/CutS family)